MKNLSDIKIALICDEFTYECFSPEFDAIVIEPSNWRQKFEQEKPEIFFCESAWSGVCSKTRPWKGIIYASKNFAKENRNVLLDILKYCREKRIPTVFWNKEDPTHYTDRTHDFVKTAILFDYIFTSAIECVETYKRDYLRSNVFCLPFATQPRLFNPEEVKSRTNDVIFAGSWYANHIERSNDMLDIFSSIRKTHDLVIYDRYSQDDDPLHKFPAPYNEMTRPAVPFKDIAKIYKASTVSLTINTVKNSKTMFARRIYELMSCNTLVISNSNDGITSQFGHLAIDIEANPNALTQIVQNDVDSMRDAALHEVLAKHTYKERFKFILDSIGFQYASDEKDLTLVALVNNEAEIEQFIAYHKSLQMNNSILLLVFGYGFEDIELAPLFTKYNRGSINTIALSYLDKYAPFDKKVIETEFIAILDNDDLLPPNQFKKAYLHTEYMKEIPLLLDQGNKYTRQDSFTVRNIIAPRQFFNTALLMKGQNINALGYSVNFQG
ncbi:glycosyltransferase [uncultured Deefgea sp.]|uniref:CgeB family protein n=1 Tax=uncultured Deefgea sp. TaxID=1304914 RepID=UPI0035B51464